MNHVDAAFGMAHVSNAHKGNQENDILTDELLNLLRYKSEGTDIDFKSTQYRFTGGSEDDKAEMLKDILAMSNAWRDGPGYILLGFKDRRPHPAEVTGISEFIDDAKVQQFVNGKLRPKLTFRYEEHLYEGKTVGVVTIPKQTRPFYLVHPYGKLKSNVVYVRRGSSTDEAEPPEIVSMAQDNVGRKEMHVDLSILSAENQDLADTFALRYLQFTEEFPDYERTRRPLGSFEIDLSPMMLVNRDFWRQYAEYVRVSEGLILMQFALTNRSEVQLSNAKLEVSVETLEGQAFALSAGSDLPEEPTNEWNPMYGAGSLPEVMTRENRRFVIEDSNAGSICHVRFGSLLPGEVGRSSDKLAIVPLGAGRLRLRSRILASELPAPLESDWVIAATGSVERLDFENFVGFVRKRLKRAQSSE